MTMTKLPRCAAIAAGGLLLATGALAEPPPGLDARVEAATQAYGTPGFALSIVEHAEVVHAQGYAVRKLGTPGKVAHDTPSPPPTPPHAATHQHTDIPAATP